VGAREDAQRGADLPPSVEWPGPRFERAEQDADPLLVAMAAALRGEAGDYRGTRASGLLMPIITAGWCALRAGGSVNKGERQRDCPARLTLRVP
jgi:hypothetical protein